MPRPSNAKYLADTAKTIKEARDKARPARPAAHEARRAQGDLHLLEQHPARRSPRLRPRTRRSTNATPPGCATTRSGSRSRCCLKSKPEELVEAGYPESQVRAFLDAYHELEQAEIQLARPGVRGGGREVPGRLARAGRSGEPDQVSHRRDDRTRDPLQRDEPVLAGPVRLWRRGWCSWS